MTKTKTFSDVTVKDAASGLVTAVFATLGVKDSDGDVIESGAIVDGAKVTVSAYGHKSWEGVLPVGTGVIHEKGNEAVAELKFFMNTTHGADTFNTVQALAEDDQGEWSFSLHDVKSERGEMDGESVNFIKAVTVREVSPVLVGAGVSTRTLSAKAADRGLKFSDQLDAVVADVDAVTVRASEVVALRAEKGKTIAPETIERLKALAASIGELVDTQPPAEDEESDATSNADDALAAEIFRAQAIAATS